MRVTNNYKLNGSRQCECFTETSLKTILQDGDYKSLENISSFLGICVEELRGSNGIAFIT